VNHLRTQGVARTKAGKRKLRLFACGCCRLIWGHLRDPRLRAAVEVAERFAEGQATKQELEEVRGSIRGLDSYDGAPGAAALEWTAIAMALDTTAPCALEAAFCMTAHTHPLAGHRWGEEEGEAILCDLVREVFGNPFRPVLPTHGWRTRTVVQLAQAAYDHRALPNGHLDAGRLAVLADALEEAGCGDADLLWHLRGPGPHVRACWAVDLVLGKS
jgi:hypothetical protein